MGPAHDGQRRREDDAGHLVRLRSAFSGMASPSMATGRSWPRSMVQPGVEHRELAQCLTDGGGEAGKQREAGTFAPGELFLFSLTQPDLARPDQSP